MLGRLKGAGLALVLALVCCRQSEERTTSGIALATQGGGAGIALLPTRGPVSPSAGPASSTPAERVPSPEPPPLPALSANWLERLDLEDGNEATVSVPVGARGPRPVMIAVHGAGDRPEWACGGWRIAADAFPFIVCPRGSPIDKQRFAWSSASAISLSIERSLGALKARFGDYVAGDPKIFAGFSQGATLSREILLGSRRFDTAILAEGGYDISQDAAFARRFRELGGERVLLACGTPGCFTHAAKAKRTLERAGLSVFVAGDARSGHNLNEPMQRALRAVWPSLVLGKWPGF